MKITACLITLNEEKKLHRCLSSVQSLVDEIVVIDSGSQDRTRQIALELGARVIEQNWLGYVGQKNFAMAQAKHPWILSLDADEEISPELADSIRMVRTGDLEGVAGYEVSRLVYFQNRWIYHGDWYPDRLVRLFRNEGAKFTGGRVHERLEVPGKIERLAGDLYHYTYDNSEDRSERIQRYAQLWAETARERGRQAAIWSGPLHAGVRLIRGFVLKRGFLDGDIGWEIAVGNAREVWLKYALLRKLNREHQSS